MEHWNRNIRLRLVMLTAHLGDEYFSEAKLLTAADWSQQWWSAVKRGGSGGLNARTMQKVSMLLAIPMSVLVGSKASNVVLYDIPAWPWLEYVAQSGAGSWEELDDWKRNMQADQ